MNGIQDIFEKIKGLRKRSRVEPKKNRRHLLVPIFSVVIIAILLMLPKQGLIKSPGPMDTIEYPSAIIDALAEEMADAPLVIDSTNIVEVTTPAMEVVAESVTEVVSEGWNIFKIVSSNLAEIASTVLLFANVYFLFTREKPVEVPDEN